ncbi:MAG: hypothetical protein QOH09_4895 [Pseudonocardiales bacterium]|nr:hypothetical protein [Pseudonocardiales bacterium]
MTLDKDLANDLPRSNTGGPRQSGTSLTPPLSHAVPVAVPGARAPGNAVSTSSGQPGGEIGGESSGLESGVAGRGEPKSEPELMDLRLHAPTPEVVVVRVSARCRGAPPRVLAERVSQQPCRAPHVDVDLGQVSVLDPGGLTVLSTLHQQATVHRTQLHIVGVEHEALRQALHSTGLMPLLRWKSTADAVIAALPAQLNQGLRSLC